jgi:hypothetical protein
MKARIFRYKINAEPREFTRAGQSDLLHQKRVVIPQNFLFEPQSGEKENLCGIRFGFMPIKNRKSDSA